MKAIAYTRVSTSEQANNGQSLDHQREALQRYCDYRGLELGRIVVDAGVSTGAPLAKRPGGADLMQSLASGEASCVVALKLDRLFRNTAECLRTIEQWEREGIALHLLDLGGQAIDTRSSFGRFMVTVMAALAELERNKTRERNREVSKHLRDTNRRHTSRRYGYDVGPGNTWVPNKRQQEAIALMVKRREQGVSLSGIASELRALKVPPPMRRMKGKLTGAKWHCKTIDRIIKAQEQE